MRDETWTSSSTEYATAFVGIDCHAETPAERAMRLSNALADAQDRVWAGEDAALPAALTTEAIDALAEYSHLLAFVARPTGGTTE